MCDDEDPEESRAMEDGLKLYQEQLSQLLKFVYFGSHQSAPYDAKLEDLLDEKVQSVVQ
jgi:hypothetical protein